MAESLLTSIYLRGCAEDIFQSCFVSCSLIKKNRDWQLKGIFKHTRPNSATFKHDREEELHGEDFNEILYKRKKEININFVDMFNGQ